MGIKPRRIRGPKVRATARMFLNEIGCQQSPLNIIEIAEERWKVVWDHWPDEGRTWYDKKTDRYFIFMDKSPSNNGRINWTLAHEVGHIKLGHLIEFDVMHLPEWAYKILEREADIFAREVLLPEQWVREYAGEPPITKRRLGQMIGHFGVSWDALLYRLEELEIQSYGKSQSILRPVPEVAVQSVSINRAPSPSLTRMGTSKGASPVKVVRYPDPFEEMLAELESTEFPMIDETASNGQVDACVFCGNDDFSENARYCKKCGRPLINECSHQQCDQINSSDAAFCETCGFETIFFRQSLVEPAREDVNGNEISYAIEESAPF